MKKKLVIGIMLILSGCAQTPLNKQTNSGYAEGVFEGAQLDDIKNRFVFACNQKGYEIKEASSNKVVCSKTLEGMNAVFTQALIGNQYSTTPEELLVFQLARMDNNVQVSVRNYRETQMAFGQMSRVEIKNNKTTNLMQQSMDRIVGEYNAKREKPLTLQSAPPPMQ
ncbi:hypothetical protein [Acinetobacter junii]|uniref:hypothetical protein n=1 Tax=Acinetobacter junii TaxID=40215 RepID=UPI00100DEC06|nr:hypothetical protein [Acinetobacter junii]RXS99013.1 hypothetical protein ETZ13_04345 [Acinetobacter junii]